MRVKVKIRNYIKDPEREYDGVEFKVTAYMDYHIFIIKWVRTRYEVYRDGYFICDMDEHMIRDNFTLDLWTKI